MENEWSWKDIPSANVNARLLKDLLTIILEEIFRPIYGIDYFRLRA